MTSEFITRIYLEFIKLLQCKADKFSSNCLVKKKRGGL